MLKLLCIVTLSRAILKQFLSRVQNLASLFVIGSFLLCSQVTNAEIGSPLFILNRCFLALTEHSLPLDPENDQDWDASTRLFLSPIVAGVKSGAMSGQDACIQILHHAELENCSGVAPGSMQTCLTDQYGKLKVRDTLSMRILSHFHNAFQSATEAFTFSGNFPNDTQTAEDFFNSHPYATGMIYTIFTPGVPVSALVTETSPIMRLGADSYKLPGPIMNDSPSNHWHRNPNVRPLGSVSDPRCSDPSCGALPNSPNCCTDPVVPWTTGSVLQSGDTIGAKPVRYEPTTYNATHNLATQNLMWTIRDSGIGSFPDPFQVFDSNGRYYYNRGDGGGVMTDPGYLLLQWPGKGVGTQTNTPANLWRRWSKAVFNDFLCNPLPGIRVSDSASFVRTDSSQMYWSAPTCVTCHASMDHLAPAVRGFSLMAGAYRLGKDATVMGKFPAFDSNTEDLARGQHIVDAIEIASNRGTFYLRKPTSRLILRSMDGDLVIANASDPSDLGRLMTSTAGFDDFYSCQISRVFRVMMNITILLGDLNDPFKPMEPTAADRAYRKLLKDWTTALRSDPDQSMMAVIERIIKSPMFSQANGRLEGL